MINTIEYNPYKDSKKREEKGKKKWFVFYLLMDLV